MKTSQQDRILGLDLIRTIAISLVVFSHATYIIFPNSEQSLATLIRVFGAIGVDLFFVLSGYLIGGILLNNIRDNKISFSDLVLFWKRRWLRTLPNYFLILCCNVIVLLLLGVALPNELMSYFLFLQNFVVPHPDFFTEAWSLSVEEYAYLFLPFLLYLGLNYCKPINQVKYFFKIVLVIIFLLTLVKISYYSTVQIDSYKQWSASFRKVVLYRVDAIYIGFLMVYITRNYKKSIQPYNKLFALIGLLLLLGVHLLIFWKNLLPQTHLAFYVFVYLQVVLCSLALLLPYFSILKKVKFGSKTIEFISKCSYSIYLINYSLVLLVLDYFFQFENQSMISRVALTLVFFMITLIVSGIMYKYFELPILAYRNKKYPS